MATEGQELEESSYRRSVCVLRQDLLREVARHSVQGGSAGDTMLETVEDTAEGTAEDTTEPAASDMEGRTQACRVKRVVR